MDWAKIIDAAHNDNEQHGVPVRGGKKYSQVATRVERFRRSFGSWGIRTEIVQFSATRGEPVVVRAIVTDEADRIIATGHAHEIVGEGNVNKTAALENAETSAVGRALAILGLHGGELASLNEIEGAGRKDEALAAPPPDDSSASKRLEREVADALAYIPTIETLEALQAYWKNLNAESYAVEDTSVIAAKDKRKAELSQQNEEAA